MYDISQFEKENYKDNFFQLMIGYHYLNNTEDKKKVIQKAIGFANKIPEFRGWPHDDKAFWNAESFMWRSKIDQELRRDIRNEIASRIGKINLDLGSGCVGYPSSVSLDYSPEMLELNPNSDKVLHDLEKPLPFPEESFDSATAVFIFNYIKNIPQLIKEINRVLAVGGRLIVVQPQAVNDLYKLHVKNNYQEPDLRILLKKSGFKTDSVSKNISNTKVTYFFCEKRL